MLADPDVDAVIVAVADQFHVPMALKALEAGKHVLVEKPMGVTVEECEELRYAARASGLVVQVGTEKRFDQGIAFARDFIREEMGEMIALKAWYCDSTHRYTMTEAVQPVIEASERARRAEGQPQGGPQALLRARAREPPARYRPLPGRGDRDRPHPARREVRGVLLVLGGRVRRRERGAPGHDHKSPHGLARGLPGLRRARQRDREDVQPLVLQVERRGVLLGEGRPIPPPLGADGHFFRRQVEGFADSILDGAPMRGANAEDGLAAMRGMVAMARSAETGEAMRLSDARGGV